MLGHKRADHFRQSYGNPGQSVRERRQELLGLLEPLLSSREVGQTQEVGRWHWVGAGLSSVLIWERQRQSLKVWIAAGRGLVLVPSFAAVGFAKVEIRTVTHNDEPEQIQPAKTGCGWTSSTADWKHPTSLVPSHLTITICWSLHLPISPVFNTKTGSYSVSVHQCTVCNPYKCPLPVVCCKHWLANLQYKSGQCTAHSFSNKQPQRCKEIIFYNPLLK